MESIGVDLSVSLEPEHAFRLTREHLPELVLDISVVEHKEREIRTIDDTVSETTDCWELDVLEPVPGFISSFLSFEKITVQSVIRWNETTLETEWDYSVPSIEGLLDEGRGSADFEVDGDETLIKMRGEFDLDLSAVPGIPGFLASALRGRQAQIAERIIGNYLPIIEEKIESLAQDN